MESGCVVKGDIDIVYLKEIGSLSAWGLLFLHYHFSNVILKSQTRSQGSIH
jgi:hypothetical protein